MKFKPFFESKNVIYQDNSGYITGYLRKDGYWGIEEFVIYPEFRGQGLAKKLASHLPQKCKLLAYPLMGMGKSISHANLIKFYEKLGFKLIKDKFGNTIMQRD